MSIFKTESQVLKIKKKNFPIIFFNFFLKNPHRNEPIEGVYMVGTRDAKECF